MNYTTKKTAIIAPYGCSLTDGGPSGFCGHNYVGVSSDLFQFYYLGNQPNRPQSIMNRVLAKLIQVFRSPPKYVLNIQSWLFIRNFFKNIDVSNFEYLFFHDVRTLAYCLDLIRPDQKVILQSHCPELPHQEVSGSFSEELKLLEQLSFKRANYIILPNEFTLPIYEELINSNHKVVYLLSGIKSPIVKSKIDLNPHEISFLYIGRRIEIKGFEVLISNFRKLYEKNKKIKLYLIGHGVEVDDEFVVDVGFSDNVALWINSVDAVINTNKQSYFDIAFMEGLSVGTPIIYSSTGGHKYFDTFKSEVLIPFEGDENFLDALLSFCSVFDQSSPNKNTNKQIYHSYLTNDKYLERFETFLKELP